MESFKEYAYRVLAQVKEPLHCKEITKRALKLGLQTTGVTPWQTMGARIRDSIKEAKESDNCYLLERWHTRGSRCTQETRWH